MENGYHHISMSVQNQTVVVLGGTSGIGEAIALGFAEEGANVVATSRTSERVADTASELRSRGAETIEVTADVTDRESIERLREETIDAFDGVDTVVNSAGTASRNSISEMTDRDWEHVLDVNLTGVYRSCQLFANAMNEGSIVNISSLAAGLARSNLSAYVASKAGLEGFTRCAAKEFAPDIRVNAVAPGFVVTPINEDQYAQGTELRTRIDERTPLGRVASREEMVGVVLYLASDAASYTTGEVIRVDGGYCDSAL